MDTWHIDADALGPVLLRIAPTVMKTKDGVMILERNTKEPIYLGELNVPGVSSARRGPTVPRAIRVRFVGSYPEGLEDGQRVLLGGKVNVSAWYRPALRRGEVPGSEITISPEAMRPTDDPVNEAGLLNLLPLRSPSLTGAPWNLMTIHDPEAWDVPVGVFSTPVDTFGNDGTVEIGIVGPPDRTLIGQEVQLEGLLGRIVFPDQRDVGRNLKSELVVYTKGIVAHRPLVSVNGSKAPAVPRPPVKAPDAPPPPDQP